MSSALVRQGLELFKEDIVQDETSSKSKLKKGLASTNRKDLLLLISSNKTGVKKQLRRLQGNPAGRNRITVKTMKTKSAFKKLRKNREEDYTEQNINYLLRKDRNQETTSTQLEHILEHARGRLTRDNPLPDTTVQDETSAFSEEDFQNFEKNYVSVRKIDKALLEYQKWGSTEEG